MDFHTMKRKELQALCKDHKIPANLTNLEMAKRLASLLEVDKEKPQKQRVNLVKSCLKNLNELGGNDEKNSEDKMAKKVRFSPKEDQTFEFEKTNPREMRLARRKSIVIAEEKINIGEKVDESVDVDNQVKSTRTRGRGKKPEQADVVEEKLVPKKKAEEIDESKKGSRKRASRVEDCEVQPLVDTRRQKATKNTVCEAKPVTRRSGRVVEKLDESASVIEQIETVKLPKRKARSDCPVNQEMEKAPTRSLRRNISKDDCGKAVEEGKEPGNGTPRVTRNARQQNLIETVSAAESAPVVEKASTGAEEVKEQVNEKAKVTRKTRQKGDIGPNETVSATESAVVVEKASTSAEEVKEQGNEKAKVTRKTRQKGDIGPNETVSAAESAPVVEKASTGAEEMKEQVNEKAKVTRKTRQKEDIGPSETVSATESAAVVEKASTRGLRRNASKDASGKAVEEAKEWGNKKARATRTTRQQKGDTGLNETVLAAESVDVVEQGQQRRSTRVAIRRCSFAPGELNGKKSDANVQERGVTLKSKHSRKEENSSRPGKSDEQTMCADKRMPSAKKHVEGSQTNVEVNPLAMNSELYSVSEAADIQDRLCDEISALEDNQDNDQSLHETTSPTPLLKECEMANAEGKAELINGSSMKKSALTKQPASAVIYSNQKGVLPELYSSDGQLTEGDEDEADTDNKYGASFDDAALTLSGVFTDGNKTELENTVSMGDNCLEIDPALTSTSIDTFTEISFPECESGSQGKYQTQLETAIPNSLIVESDADNNNNSVEGSPAKNTESEHTQSAENILEECNTLDFDNLEGHVSKEDSTVHVLGLESYPNLHEFKSWSDKPAAALEMSTLVSNEPVNPQADKCTDHLGAHESCKNTGDIEETEGVTQTPMVDERSECIDTGNIEETEGVSPTPGELNGKAELINKSSMKKSALTKQPETALISSNQKGVLLELYSSDNQLTEGYEDEADTDKEEENKEAEILDGASLDDAEVVLIHSIGFKSSPCGETSTLSRVFTQGSKTELENTVSMADYCVEIHPDITSNSIDTFTGISLPECESGSQGIYQTQLETAIPSSLIVESNADNNNSVEGSPAKNTKSEHAQCAENILEECSTLDFNNLEGQVSKEDSIVHGLGLVSYPNLHEFQSWFDKPAAALEMSTLASYDPVNPQADTCTGHLGAHECVHTAGKNTGDIEETEGVTPTPMVDERSDCVDTGHEETEGVSPTPMVECKRSHKQELEEESDSPMTIHEQTYGIVSLFQSDNAEKDSVVTSTELEGMKVAEVSDAQLNVNHEDGIFAYPKSEVNEEEGESCTETDEIIRRVNESAFSMEEAVCIGSITKVHKVSSPPSYNNNKLSESDSEIFSEDKTSEEAAAVTPNGHFLVPYHLERAYANNNNEITQEVHEDYMVVANEAIQDGVTHNSYSPVPHKEDLSHLMHQEEYENNDKNEAATPNVLDGSEEKLALPSSLEDFLGLDVLEMSSEQTGEQGSSEIFGEITHTDNEPEEEYKETVLFIPEPEEADNKVYKEGFESSEHTLLASVDGDQDDSIQQKYAFPSDDFLVPEQHIIFEVVTGMIDRVLENENPPTDEASKDLSVGLVGGISSGAEVSEVDSGKIEPPVTASVLDMCSITLDDESKNADVKGISNEDVFKGSGQQCQIGSVVDANLTSVNMEIDAFGGSVKLLTLYPAEEMEATKLTCEAVDAHIHENRENEFDLPGLLTDNNTFGCEADELNHNTSETGSTVLSSPVCASKHQEEAAVPNSHSTGISQNKLEDSDNVDQCTALEGITPAGTFEHLENDNDLQEDEEPGSSEEEIKSTGTNIECSDGKLEVQACELHPESNTAMIYDQYKYENAEEGSDKNKDIELTSYETALFMGDGSFCDKTGTLEYQTSETSLMACKMDDSEEKEENFAMEEVEGDKNYKQGFESSEYTLLASVVCDQDESIQQKYPFPNDDFLEPEQRKIFEVVTGMIDRVLEDENPLTDEASKDLSPGLVGGISSAAETLEVDSGKTEPPMPASFMEMCSITPDDESKTANVKVLSSGICNEDVFKGSGQECQIGSVVDSNVTSVNMEIDAFGGSVMLLTPLPEPSYPVEQLDATKLTCEAVAFHIHENRENEFELAGMETDNDTFGCEADELNHTTSENGSTIVSSPVFASKHQEEAAIPNSHSTGICEDELEVSEDVDQCTVLEGVTPAATFEHLENDNAFVIQPMSDILEDLKEDEEPESSEEEIKSSGKNVECSNGELEVQACELYQESNTAMIYDQYKYETAEGISKEDDVMSQQEMKSLNDEVRPDVYDEDLSKPEHEDKSIPDHATLEEEIKSTAGNMECSIRELEMNTQMISDQYKSEYFKAVSNEDEIMPQQEIKPLNDGVTPDVYGEDLSKLEPEEKSIPEHSRTSELVSGTFEHMEEDLKEEEVSASSEEEEIKSTAGNMECSIRELEMDSTPIIPDQYKSENYKGTSNEDEVMSQQEMKPLNDEVTPDVYDEDLSKLNQEDETIPEHSRTSEIVTEAFDHLEEDLKEDEVSATASLEEEIKSTGGNLECSIGELEMNTPMLSDQFKSEYFKGTSNEDEIMPQQEVKPVTDEVTPDVSDDLSKLEHEYKIVPEHSRTSELVSDTFEHMEKDLKEAEVSASSEEKIKSTAGNMECSIGELERNTPMISDQYKSDNFKGTSNEDEVIPQQETEPLNEEIRDAKLDKVEKSSKKPASATKQKKRSIMIHGTPRRPIKISDMKENSTAQLKRDHLVNATASKPLAGRKALGELSRWRP